MAVGVIDAITFGVFGVLAAAVAIAPLTITAAVAVGVGAAADVAADTVVVVVVIFGFFLIDLPNYRINSAIQSITMSNFQSFSNCRWHLCMRVRVCVMMIFLFKGFRRGTYVCVCVHS